MKTIAGRASTLLSLAGCLLILLYAAGVSAQEPLRWKLEKGQRFTLQMTQTADSLVSHGPNKLASSVEMLLVLGWDVQEADGDKFVIEQRLEAIRIAMKNPNGDVTAYDSRERKAVVGAAKDLANAVAPALAAKFLVTLSPQGAILSAEQTSAAEGAKLPGLDQQSIDQLLRQSLVPLPKALEGSEPTWTDERQLKATLGEVKQKRTFTLAGTEDREGISAAKITFKGELELTPPADQKAPPKLKEQSLTGTVWFARDPGRLLASESKHRLVSESQYRDSTITADLTTTMSSTLTPKE